MKSTAKIHGKHFSFEGKYLDSIRIQRSKTKLEMHLGVWVNHGDGWIWSIACVSVHNQKLDFQP